MSSIRCQRPAVECQERILTDRIREHEKAISTDSIYWHFAVRPFRTTTGRETHCNAFPDGGCGLLVSFSERLMMAAEDHECRGYRIEIRRHGSGWRATIYAPNSQQPILGPQSDDPNSQDEVLEEARHLIDALMN
jgi:hypothetical protein